MPPADQGAGYDVVVIGAGAAGLLAASRAAELGRRTLLLEKNPHVGVKILMSGGTRCNLTQATDKRGIVAAFGPMGSFLHSALAVLSPQQLVELIEAEGVPTKVEPTGKIFPVSNRAQDICDALVARLERSAATLALAEPVEAIQRSGEGFALRTPSRTLTTPRVLLTTGGQSYPGCGTRGDGYAFARALGHTIVPLRPALVPITVEAPWVRALSGVTIPDVELRLVEQRSDEAAKESQLAKRRGSFLFTHFGLSGPVVLDVSREVSGHPKPSNLRLCCDFLPSLKAGQLTEHFASARREAGKKHLLAIMPEALPRRLIETLLAEAQVSPECRVSEFSKAQESLLIGSIKETQLRVSGTRGFGKAEVTAGGVSLAEVDSRTMESKLVPGLFLAGEVLDLDGPIGGYNFQAAFSTGWLAGSCV
jgi:predicted Rossmann fold flavoprotein